jgi:hypothetical protein
MGLLNKIRQLFYTHHLWEGGPAQAMLDFHSKGLAKARSFSSDYQTFILKVYVYLREASEKGFYHAFMAESLWSRVSSLESPQDATQPKAPGDSRCSHCKSKDVHLLLGLLPTRTLCPFIGLSGTDLRNAIKELIKSTKSHPDSDKVKLVADIIKLHL